MFNHPRKEMVLKRLNQILKGSQFVDNVIDIEATSHSNLIISTISKPEITRFTEEGFQK